jgi:hypothetical protein
MIYQKLHLSAPLDAAGAAAVNAALRAITGMRDVGTAAGRTDVSIAFDDGHTSAQEIATVLARAGFALRDQPKASAGCCGGCGGGGH